jgi:uncharacterized protein involved in exopolysaccharide biosynthesis/Mrp family chromosome partitioning ATPase
MNAPQNAAPPPGINLDDLLYVLYRHKWKIAIIALLAVAAAGAVYFTWPLPYRSEARLLIKYVVDSKNPSQMGSAKVTSPDDRGDTILNTELEVLGSFDLALEVANDVGASNILAAVGGGNDASSAASLIRANLILDVPRRSSVIHMIFQHQDPGVVQPVLKALVDEYYKKHMQIHRDVGQFGEFLTQQTDNLHSRLLQTEDALRAAKTNAGVISVEDTKKIYSEEISRIQTAILQAEAELAERQAAATELAKLTHAEMPNLTNEFAVTNEATIPSDKLAEYKRLCNLLDKLSARQQDLLIQFTPENSWVKQIDDQISNNEKKKEQLEEQFPGLVGKAPPRRYSVGDPRGNSQAELNAELARVSGLHSKIRMLNLQLDEIQAAAAKMYASEASITDLQRKYYLQETQYNYFSMSLEQSRIDEALGASRQSNISQIQYPTPPSRDTTKVRKAALGILMAGLGLALGLAFLIEFYFDRSIKRPVEVETKLGLPLFLSIPRFALGKGSWSGSGGPVPLLPQATDNGNGKGETGADSKKEAGKGVGETVSPATNGNGGSPWSSRYMLRPFCAALRDSLITFFEVNNLTHKPKLVAVTGCSEGSGVSTIAAGLAASLSETGEGNVLLVNMDNASGAVQQFCKGKLSCDLDDALATEKREQGLVKGHLYVADETHGDNLPVVLPKRFKNLVPRLRASDYDYIIFDMPAVSQITPTQRLARFMDMVLMVVESEKTDRDQAKRVGALLVETKTNVGVILNKLRTNVPRRLQQTS